MQYCNLVYVPPKDYGIGESNLWSLTACIFFFLPLGSSYIGFWQVNLAGIFFFLLKEMPNRPCFDPEQCQSGQLHCSGAEQTTESQKERETTSAKGYNPTSASEFPAALQIMPLCWQHRINLYLFPKVKVTQPETNLSASHWQTFSLWCILFFSDKYPLLVPLSTFTGNKHWQWPNPILRPSNPLKL